MSNSVSKQDWHTLDNEQVLHELRSDLLNGLLDTEARQRLAKIGPNELEERSGKPLVLILSEQFTNTMVLILIAAAVVSGILGKPFETAAISAIVVLFGILGFLQEYRAEQAMAALKQLAVPVVHVRRNSIVEERSARDLVPGDIVLIEAGSIIPADLRLLETVNLRIQEATLTGESEPVEKSVDQVRELHAPLGDRRNMAYMGTVVTYGRGVGIVVATGMQTQLGRIAQLIQSVDTQSTPLQNELDQVGKMLAVVGVLIAGLIMVIGVVRGETLNEMFLTAVSVAVAVVPEGLPAVVTATLALGAQRMLRRRALIRKLPAVETLGSVTVICSDKTGTLTENRMTVTVIDVAGQHLELLGTAKHPAPVLSSPDQPALSLSHQPPSIGFVLSAGALCNDASLKPDPETGRYLPVGDPTEGALLVAAAQAGLTKASLQESVPRVAELPFDSVRKRMTTVHRIPEIPRDLPATLLPLQDAKEPYVAFTKGAVDGLLDISTHVMAEGQIVPLGAEWLDRIRVAHDQLAQNGMRVLGVATKALPGPDFENALEQDLVFVGLIGMIDPPRPEVKSAIETCKAAGIRLLMITGDHPLTARFIAHDLGISENGRIKTGTDLDRMSQSELETIIHEVSVYARVTPEHKLRIVENLQNSGAIVAMTGDGVNDSPALKKANIGVAMGITGTDVSKEAAQMVLLDDNFATIVAAVEEGRSIYDNLRRFVKFSIAGNLGKVIVMLFAPLLGISVALLPLQLLWLNLLTDGLLGLGLGMEPADKNTMHRPPRSLQEGFLTPTLRRHIIWVGTLIGVVALAVGYAFYHNGQSSWQTMIFTTLAFLQIGQALASRSSEESLFKQSFRSNPTLLMMVGLVLVLQLVAIYVPFLENFFDVKPLSLLELTLCAVLGTSAVFAIELEKWMFGRKPNLNTS